MTEFKGADERSKEGLLSQEAQNKEAEIQRWQHLQVTTAGSKESSPLLRRRGARVGKNQTGPNYRNHNESVSRERCYLENTEACACALWHTPAHKRAKIKSAQSTHNSAVCLSCMWLGVYVHTLIPILVWILIISLARPLWNYSFIC